ncbi:methyltransferase domain-containing protein [Streptomyces sp. NBC_00124]|uniref:methyltransferase domain-containing protein n=1 Tax=Streptomyces sp. NBC_00124 TaxID=2975662 RepID=UPI00224F06CB|nr:methyltransferase domain-containing protein [Streptomyces sp. NBC_00124]MCX5358638.1 methyltransferase domain-containing protein [Streptomyces sp. NBC_00124]
MDDPGVAHGFTSVDSQPRPGDWVQVLDRVAAEPFYAAYKQRLQESLRPPAGGLFLEVGAGTGDAAQALRSRWRAEVVAVDSSLTMVAQARERGLTHACVADGHRLPFGADRFDGAWADRVLQHVAEPGRVLDELLRVVRPGGRVALADPDYDTQVLDIDDQDLARRVLRFRADVLLRNGTLAHRHGGLLAARGLDDITVEARTLVVRDPSAVDHVMGLRTWAHTAAARGHLDPADADRFVVQFDEAARTGCFTYAVTFFLTAGTLPDAPTRPTSAVRTCGRVSGSPSTYARSWSARE